MDNQLWYQYQYAHLGTEIKDTRSRYTVKARSEQHFRKITEALLGKVKRSVYLMGAGGSAFRDAAGEFMIILSEKLITNLSENLPIFASVNGLRIWQRH